MPNSAKPHLCNPIHYGIFQLGLENLSTGTSPHSVQQLVHQQLAKLFKLSSFKLMTKDSKGKDKPLAERRVRSIAPARLRNKKSCALGVVDDTRKCY